MLAIGEYVAPSVERRTVQLATVTPLGSEFGLHDKLFPNGKPEFLSERVGATGTGEPTTLSASEALAVPGRVFDRDYLCETSGLGVPESKPVPLKVKPSTPVPDHVYDATPPLAFIAAL